jgi:hypothetical protein
VETNLEEVPHCECTHCHFTYGLPDQHQEYEPTVNQHGEAHNTKHGIGRLAMNRDEVEEGPSEAEGNEAFEKEGTDTFPDEDNTKASTYKGEGGRFQKLLQMLTRSKVEMPTKEILEQNPCCMQMLQNLVKPKGQPTTSEWISLTKDCLANCNTPNFIIYLSNTVVNNYVTTRENKIREGN